MVDESQALGVDLSGRCQTLRINYRTTRQIRLSADRLLDPQLADMDGNIEKRTATLSVLNGPPPEIRSYRGAGEEEDAVARWLRDRSSEGLGPGEIGVFVRSAEELGRARNAIAKSGLAARILDDAVLRRLHEGQGSAPRHRHRAGIGIP